MKKLILIILLLFPALAFAEWSPPGGTWPDNRGIDWSDTVGVKLALEAPWLSYTQGASVSSGASAAQIQSCLDSCSVGEYCYMGAGSYNIGSTQINIPAGVELRGAGGVDRSVTVTYTGTQIAFNVGNGGSDTGADTSISTVSKGDTTITVTGSIASFAVGDYISVQSKEDDPLVDDDGENGPCTWCGDEDGNLSQQFVKITNKEEVGSVLTIDQPAYFDYDTSPTIREYTLISRSGIAGIYINCTSSSNAKEGTIKLEYTDESWVRDVEVYDTSGTAVWLEFSRGAVVNRSYLHEADDYGSDRGYLLWMFHMNSDHFIYDNIINRARYCINFEGGGSGVVIGYNFLNNPRDSDWDEMLHSAIGFHGAHPQNVLIEGNIVNSINPDFTIGSASHGVVFRNWINREHLIDWSVLSGVAYHLVTMNIQMASLYWTVVGNVLGYYNMSGAYQYNDSTNSCSDGSDAVFLWGGRGLPNCSSWNTNAYNSRYVHHNYDYIGDEIKEWPSADTDLPDSLFIDNKTQAVSLGVITSGDNWPPIDVDHADNVFSTHKFNVVSGTAYYIPAYRRYASISDPEPIPPVPTIQSVGMSNAGISQ